MMRDFPENEEELERYIRQVKKFRDSADFEAAIKACSALVDVASTRYAGLRARAEVYADMRQPALELADREDLVVCDEAEPADHFDLGVSLWKTGQLARAAQMFTRAIEIGEQENFHYYTNVSRMHLAALLIKQHRKEEALRECMLVPEDYSSYLPDGMTTRKQLIDRLR
jgi:tetratricopeptide (TPR) repeat protein